MAEDTTDTAASPAATARGGRGGNLWQRLRSINKGQLIMIGVAIATLVVGFLAYRAMRNTSTGTALPGSPGVNNGAGNSAGSGVSSWVNALLAPPNLQGPASDPSAAYTPAATSAPGPYVAPAPTPPQPTPPKTLSDLPQSVQRQAALQRPPPSPPPPPPPTSTLPTTGGGMFTQ